MVYEKWHKVVEARGWGIRSVRSGGVGAGRECRRAHVVWFNDLSGHLLKRRPRVCAPVGVTTDTF